MATTTVSSLADVAARLEQQLNPVSFKGVTTRVLLRTGVALRPPKPDQDRDQAAIRSVTDALNQMGYQV
jgi:hypothetical protein